MSNSFFEAFFRDSPKVTFTLGFDGA